MSIFSASKLCLLKVYFLKVKRHVKKLEEMISIETGTKKFSIENHCNKSMCKRIQMTKYKIWQKRQAFRR